MNSKWEQNGPNSTATNLVTAWLEDLSEGFLHTTKAGTATEVKRYINTPADNAREVSPKYKTALTLTAETPNYKIEITKKDAEETEVDKVLK